MLNKLKGTVSATSHENHTTVLEGLALPFSSELHLAGRLDFNTTGLIILTNDGIWSRKLTLPTEKTPKTYLVKTQSPITKEYTALFSSGMYFAYENITLMPAHLDVLDDFQARLTVYEGRYHQIKRMFGYFNNKVIDLHRESMGSIFLDPCLLPGEYRNLTVQEIHSLC